MFLEILTCDEVVPGKTGTSRYLCNLFNLNAIRLLFILVIKWF